MTNITPELLRDISVKTVEGFLNDKVPLSLGLAKQAAAYDLNTEQVQRAVESTNNIAYLKVLQLSDDRTVEFPLCKFAEVMQAATVPENFQEKIASVSCAPHIPLLEKAASTETSEFSVSNLVNNEKLTYFIKSAAANISALERLESESMSVAEQLVKSAKALSSDSAWMDKLACVTTPQEFSELSVLVSGSVKPYRDLADLGLFKQAQLHESAEFANLYKQARALVKEQRERGELQKQADAVNGTIKSNLAAGAKAVVGSPGRALGQAAGYVAGTPFRTIGSAVGSVKTTATKTFQTALTGGSKPLSAAGQSVKSTAADVGGKLVRAGGAVADVAFYNPGVDESTGRSNSVWTALQGS